MCLLKCELCMNVLLHVGQLYGLSPVCMRSCLWRDHAELNTLWHHGQIRCLPTIGSWLLAWYDEWDDAILFPARPLVPTFLFTIFDDTALLAAGLQRLAAAVSAIFAATRELTASRVGESPSCGTFDTIVAASPFPAVLARFVGCKAYNLSFADIDATSPPSRAKGFSVTSPVVRTRAVLAPWNSFRCPSSLFALPTVVHSFAAFVRNWGLFLLCVPFIPVCANRLRPVKVDTWSLTKVTAIVTMCPMVPNLTVYEEKFWHMTLMEVDSTPAFLYTLVPDCWKENDVDGTSSDCALDFCGCPFWIFINASTCSDNSLFRSEPARTWLVDPVE